MESAFLGAAGKDKGSPATGSNGCGGEGIFHTHMPPHGGDGVSPPALVPSGLPYLCPDHRVSSSLLPLLRKGTLYIVICNVIRCNSHYTE